MVKLVTMPKIGFRLIKTGLAVMLAILIARLTGHLYETYCALAAATAIAPTANLSLRVIGAQLGVNVLAGLIGGGLILLLGPHAVVIGVGLVLALIACQWVGWGDMAGAMIIAVLFVMGPHPETMQTYVLVRWLSVMVGSVVGIAVNASILPPQYWTTTVSAVHRAGELLDAFIVRTAGALDHPDSLAKAEVLATTARVERQLDEARRLLRLVDVPRRQVDGTDGPTRRDVLERAIKVLATQLERVQVIHMAARKAQSASHYRELLPEIRTAMVELTAHRRELYRWLDNDLPVAWLSAQLQTMDRHFATPHCRPGEAEDVDSFFYLHQLRATIAYMANRLERLRVAMEAAAPPEGAKVGATHLRVAKP